MTGIFAHSGEKKGFDSKTVLFVLCSSTFFFFTHIIINNVFHKGVELLGVQRYW